MISIGKLLDQMNDSLVDRACKVARDLDKRNIKGEEGKNQINKAIEVAQESGSLKVLYNWLVYQAGRDKSKSFWIQNCGKKKLVERLVDEMKEIEREVGEQLKDVDPDEEKSCATEAVVRFLGFFARAYNGHEYLHLYFGGEVDR